MPGVRIPLSPLTKVTFGLPFFRYVRGVSHPTAGGLSVAPLCESVPSGRAESLSLRKGLMSKTLVRPFSFIIPTPTLLRQGEQDQTRRIRPSKEDKTKQGEGGSKARRRSGIDKKKNDSQSSLEVIFCTPSGARTLDPLIKSQLLYQLS